MFKIDFAFGNDYKKVVDFCNLKAGEVFVDIGSNRGQEIDFFSKIDINMDSYEPHPWFYNFLENNFSNLDNVTLNNLAVWEKNETKNFYFKKRQSTWGDDYRSGSASLIKEKTNLLRDAFCEVKCIDIFDVLNKHENIKILKIDTEGSEYKILKRMIETSTIGKPEFIFFEDHERKIHSSEYKHDKLFVRDYLLRNNIDVFNW